VSTRAWLGLNGCTGCCVWQAEALRKKEEYDPEIYEGASSDPYIVFSIDPPTNPVSRAPPTVSVTAVPEWLLTTIAMVCAFACAQGCKVWRTGGYFGRTVRTDMVTNTLNPSFEEARRPLAYLGTRSEVSATVAHAEPRDLPPGRGRVAQSRESRPSV
jgi:hypothetical protein